VVNFTPRTLYPRGKSPRYPLDRRLGGSQSRSGLFGEEKILYPTGIRTLNSWSSSPQLVAMPTTLSRLQNKYTLLEKIKLVNVMISRIVIKVNNFFCVCVENTSANSRLFCLCLSQNSENLLPKFSAHRAQSTRITSRTAEFIK
jgi:hypothetical protein